MTILPIYTIIPAYGPKGFNVRDLSTQALLKGPKTGKPRMFNSRGDAQAFIDKALATLNIPATRAI
jgi:hypothetical protein